MNNLQVRDLWSQLKKRKVVRVAWVYLLVCLLVILIATMTLERLGVPAYVLSLLLVVMLLGFPVAIFLAWAFEITPYGIRKDSASDIETTTKVEKHDDSMPSIAVLPFEDLSENGDQAYFCEGLAEEILDVLRKAPNLRVASRHLCVLETHSCSSGIPCRYFRAGIFRYNLLWLVAVVSARIVPHPSAFYWHRCDIQLWPHHCCLCRSWSRPINDLLQRKLRPCRPSDMHDLRTRNGCYLLRTRYIESTVARLNSNRKKLRWSSADKVTLRMNALVAYRITDARKAVYPAESSIPSLLDTRR